LTNENENENEYEYEYEYEYENADDKFLLFFAKNMQKMNIEYIFCIFLHSVLQHKNRKIHHGYLIC